MTAPILFVVNPASAGGRTGRDWAATEQRLKAEGLDLDAEMTTGPQQATEIARRAVQESRPVVVAVGGDGTLNEVVNGFFENGEPIPTKSRLAMLPTGTGGDFRRTLKIPLDLAAAAKVIASGVPRRLDTGRVTFKTDGGGSDVRHFINIADAGLGGEVVHRVNSGSKRLGAATFTLTSLVTLFGWKNKPMKVIVDGAPHDMIAAQQVVVANCQFFGGGMRMAPTASPTDGWFDIILIGDVGAVENLRGLGRIRSGTHLEQGNPKFEELNGKRVEVSSPEVVRIDVDGEQPGVLPAVFEMQQSAIEFMAPS
jgi:diacylglycerol kinase (ATP)